jgi:hypothetical protein
MPPGTGRVAYVMVMLWIAAGLAYADLVDYEIVKGICAARRGAQRAAAVLGAASPSS